MDQRLNDALAVINPRLSGHMAAMRRSIEYRQFGYFNQRILSLYFRVKVSRKMCDNKSKEDSFTATNTRMLNMQDQQVSYCRQEMMSVCAASSDNQQRLCRFYEKSNASARCMYYVFEEYCDCLKAQVMAHAGR